MEKTQEPNEIKPQKSNQKIQQPELKHNPPLQTMPPKPPNQKIQAFKAQNEKPLLQRNTEIGEPTPHKTLTPNQKIEQQPKQIINEIKIQESQKTVEPVIEAQNRNQKIGNRNEVEIKPEKQSNRSLVWDCESTLYDSFELNSFMRQLDSAIITSSSRTMSMSRIPDRRVPLHSPPPPQTPPTESRKHSKISRSLNKLLKSVFNSKPKQSSGGTTVTNNSTYKVQQTSAEKEYYVVYDTTGSLTTIPETPEVDQNRGGFSPDINSLVRKTASERFTTANTFGISCA